MGWNAAQRPLLGIRFATTPFSIARPLLPLALWRRTNEIARDRTRKQRVDSSAILNYIYIYVKRERERERESERERERVK